MNTVRILRKYHSSQNHSYGRIKTVITSRVTFPTTRNTVMEMKISSRTAIRLSHSNSTQPPLAVRTALVASTTGILTPAFPVAGFVNYALRWVPERRSRMLVFGMTSIVGCISVIVEVARHGLLPLVYSYSQLFLPFAVVNGVLAGGAYTALDLSFGAMTVARFPLAGAGIGAFVGFVGPISGLYDMAFEWIYEIQEKLGIWTTLLSNPFVLPISVSTGAAVGFIIHPFLYYPIVGIEGLHWATFSSPILFGACGLLYHLYSQDLSYISPNSYLNEYEKRTIHATPRFDFKTLKAKDWIPIEGDFCEFREGRKSREALREKIAKAKNLVFDSRRHAWVYDVITRPTGLELESNMSHCVKNVPDETEIKKRGKVLLLGDGVVGFLMMLNDGSSRKDTLARVRESLTEVTEELLSSPNGLLYNIAQSSGVASLLSDNQHIDGIAVRDAKKVVDKIELASVGVALLMQLKKNDSSINKTNSDNSRKDNNDNRNHNRRVEDVLEKNIRRLVPQILLFRTDEKDGFEGCSVEAQLDSLNWTGVNVEGSNNSLDSEAILKHKWASIVNDIKSEDLIKARRRAVALVVGLSLTVIAGILGGE